MKTKQFVWRRSANILKVIYIRRSSNGLGRGDVQPNVRFKSHLASQTRSLKGAEAKQRNKRQTRESLRLLSSNRLREKRWADKG